MNSEPPQTWHVSNGGGYTSCQYYSQQEVSHSVSAFVNAE